MTRRSRGVGAASVAPTVTAALLDMALFTADCGHRWLGSAAGYWGCPVCGRYDGDHHLRRVEHLPIQSEGWVDVEW